MTTERDKSRELDAELEAFFRSARDMAEAPSTSLMSRVLADAYAEQDAISAASATMPPPVAPPRGFLAGFFEAIGGWPAMAGLVTATAAGLWIGYNPPDAIGTLSQSLVGGGYDLSADDSLTMDSSLPDFEFLLTDS